MAGSDVDRILTDSIEGQKPLVITHHCDEGWRTFKSQFVSGSAAEEILWVKPPTLSGGMEGVTPQPGDRLGVSFRVGHKKCMFGTMLNVFGSEGFKGMIGLRWPDHVQQLQRRVFERAQPPQGIVVAVRFWRETPSDQHALDSRTVRYGQLIDLSVGGMRVRSSTPSDIEVGATYRCVFTPRVGKPSLVVDALIRHKEVVDQGRSSIGLQFVGLEASIEGRRIIDRLAKTVTQFQRSHSRRTSRKPQSRSPLRER